MKTKIVIILLVFTGLIIPQSVNDVLKKVQTKFNTMNNFTAGFSQNYFNNKSEDAGKTFGKFSFKRKNKFIVELKNQLIISDGQTIWNHDSRFNRVVISKLADDPTSFSLERFVFEYPALCNCKIIKEETLSPKDNVIELNPKNNDLQFKSAKLWISPDGMIYKMEVVDAGDIKYAFQFSDIKLNQDLPDSKFNFNPPKGIKIIDLR